MHDSSRDVNERARRCLYEVLAIFEVDGDLSFYDVEGEIVLPREEHDKTLGADIGRVVFAGDSSGSNLAATAALRAREAGLPSPTAVVMLGPVCDFNFERYDSFNRLAPKGIVYDAAFAGFMRGAYVRYEDWSHPHVSPIHANLRGFPPTILVVGSADPIVDSARAFARKLREAGNEDVELFASGGCHTDSTSSQGSSEKRRKPTRPSRGSCKSI